MKRRGFCSRYYLSIVFVIVATTVLFFTRIGLDEELCGCGLVGTPQARIVNGTAVEQNSLRWVASLFITYQELTENKGLSIPELSS